MRAYAISRPEFSGSSVSGESPGRTLGTRDVYRRNRAVPVLVRMLGFDVKLRCLLHYALYQTDYAPNSFK